MKRWPHVSLPRVRRTAPGDGVDGPGPTAHRQGASRSPVWRVATPVVGLLSGTLFVVSAHNSGGTDLRPGRYTDLASFVRVDAAQYDALKQRVADLNAQITQLNSQSDNKQVRRVTRKTARMKVLAGLEPVSGPGLTVTLTDAPHSTSADGPTAPDNRLLVVHQQDIQAVVNAMWKGGAQAVTIQGQRVVGTTGIRCIGNAVQLQGVPYSQPYVISAVGDPAALSSSIARDSYLQVYRADAEDPAINVGWDLRVEPDLNLPGYDGLLGLTYARVLSPSSSGS
ncbi:DUF881 domain-containing protein [Nocardioides cynanchi]|uniref:DUF881 domain-containing protein n=1 Tax=Nocardioides cynanchi TaxID=2558918 RepID=UPI001245708D|nr:DUF881 domain-containing protein [Nocardioides cynanchi]